MTFNYRRQIIDNLSFNNLGILSAELLQHTSNNPLWEQTPLIEKKKILDYLNKKENKYFSSNSSIIDLQ
jgi:hypothetical protein